MKHTTRALATAFLVAATLTACGDDGDPTGTAEFERFYSGTVPALGTTSHAFTATRSGTMEVVLNWPSDLHDLDLYLTRGGCAELLQCDILAAEDGIVGNSHTITFPAQAGVAYEVWVDSLAEAPSTYLIQVTIE